jgi:hypothetical protein
MRTLNLGKDITRTVDMADFGFDSWDELSPVAQHLAHKGLENVVKDTHAGITIKDNPKDYMELSEAIVDKKLDALRAGDLRVVSSANPVKTVRGLTAKQLFAMMTDEQKAELGIEA